MHVGAHLAEEANLYNQLLREKRGMTYWIESQPSKCESMRAILDPSLNTVINATIWSEDDVEKVFYETNNSESSSLLSLNLHENLYPEIKVTQHRNVTTKRVDTLIRDKSIDFVNLDIQGAELHALKGMANLLHQVKWIYCEVNREELYTGCALVEEIDSFLIDRGFIRVTTRWMPKVNWGDAIYFRYTNLPTWYRMRSLYVKFIWSCDLTSKWVKAHIPSRIRHFVRH